MSPWTWVALIALTNLTTIFLFRAMGRDHDRQHQALLDRLTTLGHDVGAVYRELLQYQEAMAQQPTPPTPWLGAFLPTDADSAALEKQILQSEDRAISATGQPTPSPAPWKHSGGRSPGGASTRPAKPSGSRS